jgi:hypothetical protein
VEEFETLAEDRRIKLDMTMRDKDDLKRKLDAKDRENMQVSKKEEEMLQKIEELQKIIKDKDLLCERKVEESFNLKSKID